MKKSKLLCLATMLVGTLTVAVAAVTGDEDPVKVLPVRKTVTVEPGRMDYQPTVIGGQRMKALRRAAANGLTADFSVQGGTSQATVWEENFDEETALSRWTVNNEVKEGFGPVTVELLSSAGKKEPFTAYDPDDKLSLHFDGDYRVSKRNTAHVTSSDIAVPANAQFHAYVGYLEWEECGLYITVSDDDFATETELWNSKNCGVSTWAWHKIDADLSAFAGKTIKVRVTYGEGTKQNFGVGGYMGDFFVDGLSITGVQTVDKVTAVTGEEISLADMSTGSPTSWQWSMPGATPETSTEQNPTIYYTRPGDYDVTLTVSDAEGMDVRTRQAFIHVDGQHPVPQIGYPAEFRDFQSRLPMVAPLVPVQWTDRSEGFPTEWTWAFDWTGSSSSGIVIPEMMHDQNPVYKHDGLGEWNAVLVVKNDSSTQYTSGAFHVGYGAGYQSEGMITNFQSGETATTYQLDGTMPFPGAFATYKTGFAEKFSKPSRPVMLMGAYVYVTAAPTTVDYTDLENITFCLRKSENGLPGELIDMDVWTNIELGYALANNSGMVQLEFNASQVLDDEFFITIEDVPAYSNAYSLAFAMTPMRDHDNTAFFMDKNGNWRPMTGYLSPAPGGQSSLAVFPIIAHSVMSTIVKDETGRLVGGADSLIVGKQAGVAEQPFFSWLGYEKDIVSDASWCRVVSEPNEMTLDTLDIQFDALPAGMEQREAHLTLTDLASTYVLRVIQRADGPTAIVAVEDKRKPAAVEYYDLSGRRLKGPLPKGIYIVNGKKVKL